MAENTNHKDEYLFASELGDDLFGALVFINPKKRKDFEKLYADLNIPLTELFRVTNVKGNKCSILFREKVHWVKSDLLKTRNPNYQPY